jgi:hypothetical protein
VSLRPELTLSRAVGPLLRWSWLIALIAVGCGLAARTVADSHAKTTFTATAKLRDVEVTLKNSQNGSLVPVSDDKTIPTSDELILAPVVRRAAAGAGVTEGVLRHRLSAKAIDADNIQFTYAAPTRAEAQRALSDYVQAYVTARRAQQLSVLQNGLASLGAPQLNTNGNPVRGSSTDDAGRQKLQAAITALPTQIARQGDLAVSEKDPAVSSSLALLAGALAGAALGVLVVLAMTQFDPMVRRRSALSVPGVDVFSSTPEDVTALRVELELTGRSGGGVIAVVPVGKGSAEAAAGDLARSFAATGTATVLLDVTPGGSGDGARGFLAGAGPLPVANGGSDLWLIPPGGRDADDARLFSTDRVAGLLAEARKHGSVVVVLADDPCRHPGSLLVCGAADAAVAVVRPRTRWSELEDVVDRVVRVASTRLALRFESGSERSARQRVPRRSTADEAAVAESAV